jgi:hypothetical protein
MYTNLHSIALPEPDAKPLLCGCEVSECGWGSLRLLTKRGYKPMSLASVPRLVFAGVSNWRITPVYAKFKFTL